MKNALVFLPVLAFAAALSACAEAESEPHGVLAQHAAMTDTAADEFLRALGRHCGASYAGRVVESGNGNDDRFDDRVMILHIADCGPSYVRMPFQVSDDRQRALVVERTARGLHLYHEHHREDGMPLELSDFGGISDDRHGAPLRQEFVPDPFTIAVLEQAGITGAATNVWVLELEPGEVLRYELVRNGDRQVVIEFDLVNPVELPDSPLVMHERLKETGTTLVAKY